MQNHYNLLHRDDEHEAIPECEALGIGYLRYFPLASGLLTGQVHGAARRHRRAPACSAGGSAPPAA